LRDVEPQPDKEHQQDDDSAACQRDVKPGFRSDSTIANVVGESSDSTVCCAENPEWNQRKQHQPDKSPEEGAAGGKEFARGEAAIVAINREDASRHKQYEQREQKRQEQ